MVTNFMHVQAELRKDFTESINDAPALSYDMLNFSQRSHYTKHYHVHSDKDNQDIFPQYLVNNMSN